MRTFFRQMIRVFVGVMACLGSNLLAQNQSVDCLVSPFGRIFEIGGEKEIYVGGIFGGTLGNNTARVFWRTVDQATEGSGSPRLVDSVPGPFQMELARTRFTSSHIATAGDLTGDGHDEFVQGWKDVQPNGQPIFRIATTDYQTSPPRSDLHWHLVGNLSQPAIAVGNVDGARQEDSGIPSQNIVLAGLEGTNSDAPVVYILGVNGTASTGEPNSIAAPANQVQGSWRDVASTGGGVAHLAMAVGEVTGDRHDDIVLALTRRETLEIIVLEWVGTATSATARNLREVTRWISTPQIPKRLRLAVGPVDDQPGNEIILATGTADPDDPLSNTSLTVAAFDVVPPINQGKHQIVLQDRWTLGSETSDTSKGLTLSLGDTDADTRQEIVLGYYNNTRARWEIRTLNASLNANPEGGEPHASATIASQSVYTSASERLLDRNIPKLQTAVGDLDGDGFQDIIVAVVDRQDDFRLFHLVESFSPNPQLSQIAEYANFERNQFAESPVIALGDRNNDSIRATFGEVNAGLVCKTFSEEQITAVAYSPPYWNALQKDVTRSATIGRSSTSEQREGKGITSSYSHTVSAYIGATAGGKIPVAVHVEAALRATAAYEFEGSASASVEHGQSNTISSTSNINNSEALVLYSETRYQGFNYQVNSGGEPLDGQLRFSELKGVTDYVGGLQDWDHLRQGQTNPSWTPILRDWANLALFRGRFARQSSTLISASADRAVDGKLDGHFTAASSTRQELEPWWEVDLGNQKTIRHVRLRNRTDTTRSLLRDVWIFISPTPFGQTTLSKLKANGSVARFFYRGAAGETLHFLTQQRNADVVGRFVRIQLEGTATLSLAEAQVFGPPHIEPDQYPTALRRSTRGAQDVFELQVFNPQLGFQWVENQGQLEFDGSKKGNQIEKAVGPSFADTTQGWSLEDVTDRTEIGGRTFSTNTRVGVEFDISAGTENVRSTYGNGYEFSAGIDEDFTTSKTYATGLEIGGEIGNFRRLEESDPTCGDQNKCRYSFIPYTYDIVTRSNAGFTQRYMVVDYLVPNTVLERSVTEDYCACRDQSDRPEPEQPLRFLAREYNFEDPNQRFLGGAFQNPGALPNFLIGEGPSGLKGDRYVSFDGERTMHLENASRIVGFSPGGLTMEAWIRLPQNPSERIRNIVTGSNPFQSWYRFYLTTDYRLGVSYSGSGVHRSTRSLPPDGQWHHIAQVTDLSGEIRFYIDGEPAGTSAYRSSLAELGFALTQAHTLNIGVEVNRIRNGDTSEYRQVGRFEGDMDRLRFTPTPLASWELDFDPDGRGATRIDFPNTPANGLEGFYPSPRGFATFNANSAHPISTTTHNLEITGGLPRNSGLILTGFIVPPETGQYRFQLNTSNPAEFYLSTDPYPVNTSLAASTASVDSSLSRIITLTKGEHYFYEAIMREQTGRPAFTVAWKRPSDTTFNPNLATIDNAFLRPLGAAAHTLRTPPAVADRDKDPDNDKLTNQEEYERGTDPTLFDTDDDGLNDKVETNDGRWRGPLATGTDPLNYDSDDDGLRDGVETNSGVLISETKTGTDPHEWDTDGDGVGDGDELTHGFDPLDPNNTPNLTGRRNNFFATPNTTPTEPSPTEPEATSPEPEISDTALLAYWDFNTASDPTLAHDGVGSRSGELVNGARYSNSGTGFSGQIGDRALDLGDDQGGQHLRVAGEFLNQLSANNQLTIVLRQKLRQVTNSTMFKGISPSSSGAARGFSGHIPWGDNTIYSDSGGCCNPELHRIAANIETLGDPQFRFTDWHTFTFIKDNDRKSIWIDDQLFLEGNNAAPLPSDFTDLFIGSAGGGTESMIGLLDDFAIFSRPLTSTEIASVAAGQSPAAVAVSEAPTQPTGPNNQEPPTSPPSTMEPSGSTGPFALSFDGDDDYVRVNRSMIPTDGEFTIEFWYQMEPDALGTFREAISQAHASRFPRFYVGITPTGNLRAGDQWADTGVRIPTDNHWHHVAVVRSNNDTHILIDAVLKASRGSAIENPSQEPFMDIGRQFNGSEHWQGALDELRIWSTARTQEEISATLKHTLRGDESELVAYYPFDEGGDEAQTQNAVLNASGRTHGSLEEGTSWTEGLSLNPALAIETEPEPETPAPTPNPEPPPVVKDPNLPSSLAACDQPGVGGRINFVNFQGPVTDHEGNPGGNGVIGQIWAGPTATSLQPICEPVSIFASGFFSAGVVELPFSELTAFVQLRAWSGALNRNDAPFRGESDIASIQLVAADTPLPPPSLPTAPFQLIEAPDEAPPTIDLPGPSDLDLTIRRQSDGTFTLEWTDSIRLQLQAAEDPAGPWVPVLTPGKTLGNRSPLEIDPTTGPSTIAVPGQKPFSSGTAFFRLVDLLAEVTE